MNRSPQNPNQAYLLSTIFEKEEDVKENPFVFNKTAIGTKKAEYENYKFEGTRFKKGKDSEFELKERYFIYHENNLVSFKVRGRENPTLLIPVESSRHGGKGCSQH